MVESSDFILFICYFDLSKNVNILDRRKRGWFIFFRIDYSSFRLNDAEKRQQKERWKGKERVSISHFLFD